MVFQKHHNFTCWLAINENKIDFLRLSETSQFYMLIGNEWKMQTIWWTNLLSWSWGRDGLSLSKTMWIYLLRLFLIVNFDFWFGQGVTVKLGSLFCKYFLTINDLYNGIKILNLPLAVVEIWFFLILNFDFRFGQEVKVNLESPFCKCFLTINDLYNGAKIVNLPLAVVEI